MKKTMNILGATGIVFFILGLFFKFFHWPGGPILILAAGFLQAVFFLPAFGYTLFYNLSGHRSKTTAVLGAITFCLIGLATIFKLNHWPLAGIFVLLQYFIGAVLALPFLLAYRLKSAQDRKHKTALISGHLGLVLLGLGILFKTMHWPGGSILLILSVNSILWVYIPVTVARLNRPEAFHSLRAKLGVVALVAFLVFAIYGIGASNTILHSFISLEESIKESEAGPAKKRELLYQIFDQLRKNEAANKNVELQYVKAAKVKELSDHLYNDIEKLKSHLVASVDRVPEQMPAPSIEEIYAKDNFDIPSSILIGDPQAPNKGAFSGAELRAKINVYRDDILSLYPDNILRNNAEQTIGLKTPDYVYTKENYKASWEENNFHHKPIVAIMTYLSKLQLDVRNTEAATVETLYNLAMNAGMPAADVKK